MTRYEIGAILLASSVIGNLAVAGYNTYIKHSTKKLADENNLKLHDVVDKLNKLARAERPITSKDVEELQDVIRGTTRITISDDDMKISYPF